jgi:hypothetical protein
MWDDDHKSFQPHTDDNGDGGDQGPRGGPPSSNAKDRQRNDETKQEHSPEVRCEPPRKFRIENDHVEGLPAVEDGDVFGKRK